METVDAASMKWRYESDQWTPQLELKPRDYLYLEEPVSEGNGLVEIHSISYPVYHEGRPIVFAYGLMQDPDTGEFRPSGRRRRKRPRANLRTTIILDVLGETGLLSHADHFEDWIKENITHSISPDMANDIVDSINVPFDKVCFVRDCIILWVCGCVSATCVHLYTCVA